MQWVIAYIGSLTAFLAIDGVWLGVISKNLYQEAIGHLMAENVKLLPVVLFYVLYVIGVVLLAVKPGIDANSIGKTLLFGAVLGFVAYGTYDFTNFATLQDWPAKVVLIDVIWGTFLTASASAAGYYAVQIFS